MATVQEWLLDPEWLARAVEDALRNEFFASREEAAEQLRRALMDIEEIYRGLDEIFYQIDLRHNQYLRASFERARYLSQHSSGVDQYLARILEWMAAGIRRGDLPAENCLPGLFNLVRPPDPHCRSQQRRQVHHHRRPAGPPGGQPEADPLQFGGPRRG
ncbi:Uncharacterized [Moorella glycerini]|uniref:Uncharacterized protein n=1 Tax=Neomoorella stamsii TaxID=1266720 RepID=A0A9X7J656_9FIRM|nr:MULTISPECIES: Wadjet anti-phage system protein JetA family protein [Moorella]PRR77621.1 hypothetical protein MOST_01180 [Moorella stamsii]CEP68534.1 Uncharacterized [Moorella glycerini]